MGRKGWKSTQTYDRSYRCLLYRDGFVRVLGGNVISEWHEYFSLHAATICRICTGNCNWKGKLNCYATRPMVDLQ